LVREARQWRVHHPTVIALHGIAANITEHSGCLGLCVKQSNQYYGYSQALPGSLHADLLTPRVFEECLTTISAQRKIASLVFVNSCWFVSGFPKSKGMGLFSAYGSLAVLPTFEADFFQVIACFSRSIALMVDRRVTFSA
jgi:hypothetical protein